MRVIIPPLSRLTLMRRNGIGRLESPLLASTTSASPMILKPLPMVLRTCRDCVLRKRVFGACNEESLGSIDLLPPAEVIIALVEDIGRAGFELGLATDLNVVDGRWRNLDATGDIAARMIDDVHLHAADATVPFGPFAHLAQRNRARVDQPDHLGPLHPRVSIGLLSQHR